MKLNKIFLTILLSICSVVSVYGVRIGDLAYILNDTKKTASVTYILSNSNSTSPGLKNPSYPTLKGSVFIPSTVTYNGTIYSVTSIGESAFMYCNLTSIDIPNSVTSIGESAFYGCSALSSVDIPNTVTKINKRTFESCSSLTSVVIPNSVNSIEEWAFARCSGLMSIVLPESVTYIGQYALSGCSSLTSVLIHHNVKFALDYEFAECNSNCKIYTIDDNYSNVSAKQVVHIGNDKSCVYYDKQNNPLIGMGFDYVDNVIYQIDSVKSEVTVHGINKSFFME